MSKLCSLKNISIGWIYLEAGKGKGTAGGIGDVVKRAFTDIILQHPDSKFECYRFSAILAQFYTEH